MRRSSSGLRIFDGSYVVKKNPLMVSQSPEGVVIYACFNKLENQCSTQVPSLPLLRTESRHAVDNRG